MNKKLIIASLGIILILSVLVVAQSVTNNNRGFAKDKKDALTRINLEDYDYTDTYLDVDTAQRCLTKSYNKTIGNESAMVSAINTCGKVPRYETICKTMVNETCTEYEKSYYDETEMEAKLTEWEMARIDGIADAQLGREARALASKTTPRTGKNTIILK